MSGQVVAFGLVDTRTQPPALMGGQGQPTKDVWTCLVTRARNLNASQDGERYVTAKVFRGGGFEVAEAPGEWHTATIKWFHLTKGYGFVTILGSGQDVFVHIKTALDAGFTQLLPGQTVSVCVVETSKGSRAIEIART